MTKDSLLTLISPARQIQPLDICRVRSGRPGRLVVRDGRGRIYLRRPIDGETEFTVSGAVGSHLLCLEDALGTILATACLTVTAATAIASEDDPRLAGLLRMLRWNLAKGVEFRTVREDGEVRCMFSDWLRDHVHILKGKRYVHAAVAEAIDLFARHQRADGMLYDFYMPHRPGSLAAGTRFKDPAWVKVWEDGTMFFQRIPVENDVEYLFVLGVHQAWQASGDDAWLAAKLDASIKALTYSQRDPLRWSERHGLLKRGFTLDTWDWQPLADSARVGDLMDIDGQTGFCIFHGDNTGFARSCTLLAAMLERSARAAEAPAWRELGTAIMRRLDGLAWNPAGFYRHQVPEDPAAPLRDLGADPAGQVSLSNAYALGRDLGPGQARAILATYRRIRRELPADAQGEFISLHPPCTRGWKERAGEYVNGGIFPFIGGELAAGAFRHGESAYGADLLARLHGLLLRYHGEFPYYWYSDLAPRDPGELRVVDISARCNVGFGGGDGVPQWTGEGPGNDLSLAQPGEHLFHGIPCRVVDPAANRGAGCIGLHPSSGYAGSVDLPLGGRAGAIYLHHCMAGHAEPLGWIDLRYADGGSERIFVRPGVNVANWWDPQDGQGPDGRPYTGYAMRTAIVGDNRRTRVGTYLWGFDNPHPDRELAGLTCTHGRLGAYWFILGLTLGSGPRWLGTRPARTGWLENWNAAAVLHALIEGQAGLADTEAGFAAVTISPRWAASGTRQVRVCAHYPAGDGYCAYDYRHQDGRIRLRLAGSGGRRQVSVLLPTGSEVTAVRVDGVARDFALRRHGDDRYCDLAADGYAASEVEVDLS